MNYFEDVYLKRMNRYGDTIQTRVQGQMMNEFESLLKKSINRVDIYSSADRTASVIGVGVLQQKTIDEKQVTDYLLTRVSDKYNNGEILYIENNRYERQPWLVLTLDKFQTIGYNRYQVVLLENEVKWIDRNKLIHSSLAHYTNIGGSRNNTIASLFKIFDNTAAVDLPNKTLYMVMPFTPYLKRSTKFNISDSSWEVSGYDMETIEGVMYVTLKEIYTEPDILETESLLGWSFTSTLGNPLYLKVGENTEVEFVALYNEELREEVICVECNNKVMSAKRLTGNKFIMRPLDEGPTSFKVYLQDSPDIFMAFEAECTDTQESYIGLVGPSRIRVGQQAKITLQTNYEGSIDVSSKNNCFTIDKVDGLDIYVTGETIGLDTIVAVCNGDTYETPIEIISMWM